MVEPLAAAYCDAVVAGQPLFPSGLDELFPLPEEEFFVSFCVYFLFKKIDNTMPHIIQILINRAIVENDVAVISDAESVVIPTCSAAACATCVS